MNLFGLCIHLGSLAQGFKSMVHLKPLISWDSSVFGTCRRIYLVPFFIQKTEILQEKLFVTNFQAYLSWRERQRGYLPMSLKLETCWIGPEQFPFGIFQSIPGLSPHRSCPMEYTQTHITSTGSKKNKNKNGQKQTSIYQSRISETTDMSTILITIKPFKSISLLVHIFCFSH